MCRLLNFIRGRSAVIAAWLCVISCVGLFIWYGCQWINCSPGVERIPLEGWARQKGVELFFDKLALIGSLSVGVIGGLSAAVFLGERPINIDNAAKKCVFFFTLVFLISSLSIYLLATYDSSLSFMFYHGGMDIGAPRFKLWAQAQAAFFLAGVIWAAVVLALGRKG